MLCGISPKKWGYAAGLGIGVGLAYDPVAKVEERTCMNAKQWLGLILFWLAVGPAVLPVVLPVVHGAVPAEHLQQRGRGSRVQRHRRRRPHGRIPGAVAWPG